MAQASDIVVVGGGVIGLSVADRLAREGLGVTLLERGVCGRESSWAAAGVLEPPRPSRRSAGANLKRASLRLHESFCADLGERSGIDPQFSRCGRLILLHDQDMLVKAREDARLAAESAESGGADLTLRLVMPEEVRRVEPRISDEIAGALHCTWTAQVRPPRLLAALRVAAERAGVRVEEQREVRELILEGGKVGGVRTDRGDVAAGGVVLCAGAWSSRVDGRAAAAVPTFPVRGQFVLLDSSGHPAAAFVPIVDGRRCYLVRRGDGTVYVGATVEPGAGFERRNTARGVHSLLENARKLVASLADVLVLSVGSGLRPGTPDRRPILGAVPGMPGLLAAAGHYRSGIALAPITAQIICDLVVRGETTHDISKCRPARWGTGALLR